MLVTTPAARANVIEPTPALPPTVGGYSLPLFCLVGPASAHVSICVQNAFISNFNLSPPDFSTGSELEDGTALFTADFYQNNGTITSPVLGSLLGPFSATANIGFDFVNRGSASQLGTFTGILTEFDFTGVFLGNSISAQLNPSQQSSGLTTISAKSLDGPFTVNSFFDVFAELSVDGSPFVPGPERIADLTSTPEPSSILLLISAAVGLGFGKRFLRPGA